MGLIQSVTQIQEQTLSFVPKFIAVGAVIALSGSWMIAELVALSRSCLRWLESSAMTDLATLSIDESLLVSFLLASVRIGTWLFIAPRLVALFLPVFVARLRSDSHFLWHQ